jgi:hypothetical protein
MTQFFTATERANFEDLGWDVCGSSAYIHLESVGLGINVEADGELSIQSNESGKWRWVHTVRYASALLAACEASTIFYNRTGWELFSWKGAPKGNVFLPAA